MNVVVGNDLIMTRFTLWIKNWKFAIIINRPWGGGVFNLSFMRYYSLVVITRSGSLVESKRWPLGRSINPKSSISPGLVNCWKKTSLPNRNPSFLPRRHSPPGFWFLPNKMVWSHEKLPKLSTWERFLVNKCCEHFGYLFVLEKSLMSTRHRLVLKMFKPSRGVCFFICVDKADGMSSK